MTHRFDDFELAELQTMYLGLARLRDSRWFAQTDSYVRLHDELQSALSSAGRRGTHDLAAEVVAAIA